jgi:hypothetical protein
MGQSRRALPAIVYNYFCPNVRVWVVPWFDILGLFVTELFTPDTTGIDLHEQRWYWAFVREGRAADYHGVTVHPRYRAGGSTR